jgi:hypothetical protein
MAVIFELSCGFDMILAAIGFGFVVFVVVVEPVVEPEPVLPDPVVDPLVVDPLVVDVPLVVGFPDDFDVVVVGLPVGCEPAVGGLPSAYAGAIARHAAAVNPTSTCVERMDTSASSKGK